MGPRSVDLSAPETTNVVSLKPTGKSAASESSFDVQRLLIGCRDRLVHGAATAFAEHLASAAANLLASADRATASAAQERCFAASRLLTTHGQAILQQFRQEFVSSYDAALSALDRPIVQPATVQFSDLCLVEDQEFERELTISRLSSRADYNCSQQLTALDRRIAALRQGRRLTQAANPLYPKAVFTSFLVACQAHGACDQVDLVMLQEFGHQVTTALPAVYREVNHYLSDRNVLPNLPLGAVPAPDAATAPAAHSDAVAGPQTISETTSATAFRGDVAGTTVGRGGAIPEDVFAQIASRLLASQPLSPPLPPERANATPIPAYAAAQVMEALTQLQRGIADTQRCPGVDPHQVDPTSGELLRRIRATPLIAWSDPMDAITVDVVTMLFDLILNDRDLPAALRAEIGRLQIPVLKVAMMDKGFFSNRHHPARRFLDAIAGASTGWTAEAMPRLLDKVRVVVETVLDGFEQDTGIFSSQLAILDGFLADEAQRATETASTLREAVEQEGRKAVVRQVVSGQIQRHTSQQDLPALVRDFLERFWHLALLNAYLRSGDQGKEWKDSVAAMDDLVWSVTPKTSAEERGRLLRMLPELLARLRGGLASIDMAEDWEGFYAHLVHLHAAAMHQAQEIPRPITAPLADTHLRAAPVRKSQAEPPPKPTPTPESPDSVAVLGQPRAAGDHKSPAGRAEHVPNVKEAVRPTRVLEPAEAVPPAPSPKSGGDNRYLDLARGLKVGAWIEFMSARGTKRILRLNWCSQQRGAYLFSNLHGDDTMIVATTRLAEQLRKGDARLMNQGSLTERAVSRLWTDVAGNPSPQSHD